MRYLVGAIVATILGIAVYAIPFVIIFAPLSIRALGGS